MKDTWEKTGIGLYCHKEGNPSLGRKLFALQFGMSVCIRLYTGHLGLPEGCRVNLGVT